MIKYGDLYLRLYRESDYADDLFHKSSLDTLRHSSLKEDLDESILVNTHSITDCYSYYVEAVADPSTMFELTKFGKTYGYIEVPNAKNLHSSLGGIGANVDGAMSSQSSLSAFSYKMRSDDVIIHQADDYVHATLEDGVTRFPETVDIFTSTERASDSSSKASQSNAGTTYNVRRGKSLFYDAYKV